jgi:uncharacterized protein (DUF3820 family)
MIRFSTEGIHLDFGKHRGKPISEVPDDYLCWILREINDEDDEQVNALREAVNAERHHRKHEGVGTFDFGE